jgi:ATP-dependent exoDNAse (exonuclease V) beta subunit
MANKWTEQQLEAINKEGSNIIVSAGAGSGKTAVSFITDLLCLLRLLWASYSG